MSSYHDGPYSPLCQPVALAGNTTLARLANADLPAGMAAALPYAPSAGCTGWGIPFQIDQVVDLHQASISADLSPITANWLIFMHTADRPLAQTGRDGFESPARGDGQLGVHVADYVFCYQDGTEVRVEIKRRHQLAGVQGRWGENCVEAVAHRAPHPLPATLSRGNPHWGKNQTRLVQPDSGEWVNWLWAWQNPHPDKPIQSIRFEPISGRLIISAISAAQVSTLPLRWQSRQKILLTLPEGEAFLPELDEQGLLKQIQLDLGQVIAAQPRPAYPHEGWPSTANNEIAPLAPDQVLVEYTAHPEAFFHMADGQLIPVADLDDHQANYRLQALPPARQRVTLRAIDKESGRPVAVKLHIHGQWGEYLAPLDRHRIVNPAWFEDYSVDFIHGDPRLAAPQLHTTTYIPGETVIDLPLGPVYIEVSKGFEVRPVRQRVEVTAETETITIPLEKLLPWRQQGWVTADTHVHFLSPTSALLEGAAEGVNIINLLASQWGELMTNVGDFDGRTTWGSAEAGGEGEYLVRVGSENRQHVLGHISLLGYGGRIIAPLCSGGPDEAALGDPVEVLLTEWARQCKAQGGLVVIPHFPEPRLENAATLVCGEADAIEMTSWGDLYSGIDPYTLSDWYRYLNCGYLVPAVGGTDKMSANMAVGTVRTYARLKPDEPFTYTKWMEAVRRRHTFVTYGPLLQFDVEGQPMGSHLRLDRDGGTVTVNWQVASVTVPVSRVELVVNGEIRESLSLPAEGGQGHWTVKLERSAWLALLVRGQYANMPEMIAAHSTPVMVELAGSPFMAAADAVTILEQIEGSLAYLDSVGTRAEVAVYQRMRLVLTAAHRLLHNRLHEAGVYHDHNPVTEHTS